jgi:CHAT domain-containing protein
MIERYDVEEGRLRDLDEQKSEYRLPPVYWAAFTLSGDWR